MTGDGGRDAGTTVGTQLWGLGIVTIQHRDVVMVTIVEVLNVHVSEGQGHSVICEQERTITCI